MLTDVVPSPHAARVRGCSRSPTAISTLLQLNDGTLFTEFTDDCDRVENGLKTINNPDIEGYPIAAMGCAEQFRQGQYIYDDRLRGRRFPADRRGEGDRRSRRASLTTPARWST